MWPQATPPHKAAVVVGDSDPAQSDVRDSLAYEGNQTLYFGSKKKKETLLIFVKY